MKKRFMPMLLCVIMLLSVFLPFRAIAADSDKWIYEFTLKVKNKDGAQSRGNSVFGFIEFYGQNYDTELKFQIKKSGEVKKNSTTKITQTSNYAPWNVDWVGIRNTCDDAVCVEYISARYARNQRYPDWKPILIQYNPKSNNEKWIETQTGSGYDVEFKKSINIKRDLYSLGNFSDLGGQTVLDVGTYYGSSSFATVQWKQEITDQYGTYNCFDYFDAPGTTVSANAEALDENLSISWGTLTADSKITELKSSHGAFIGFSINRGKMLAYMNEKSINKIEIVTRLKFSTRGVNKYSGTYKSLGGNSYGEIVKTYTIIRNTFSISDISYYNTTRMTDSSNYYYGKSAGEIRLQLKINTEDNNEHLTKSMLSGKTVSFSSVGIQVGKGVVIRATKKTAVIDSYGRFNLYIPLSVNLDSMGNGSTLILEGGSIKIGSVTYKLCEERVSFTPGYFSDYHVGQNYKIDTTSPSVEIRNINEDINGWRKTISFTAIPSENISIPDDDETMNVQFVQNVSQGGTVTKPYYIYNIETNKSDRTGSTILTAGAIGGFATNLTLALSDDAEVIGKLYLSGYDIAGNPLRQVLTDIRLDNSAPRFKLDTYYGERAVDGSKSVEYRFKLIDASGTGKIYYCFTSGNNSPPAITGNVIEHTGTLETTLGRWAFINQSDNEIDGTALIKCALGRNFNGRIYYYTEDAFGNRSNVSDSVISIDNENTSCDITAVGCDMSVPQKNYNIVIKSAEANTVYWRWRSSASGGFVGEYALYTSGTETGSENQSGKNGLPMLLDGTWMLEVKIVAPSGRYTTVRKSFTFDNSNPGVTISVSEPEKFRNNHTVTVKADDPSGISEAYADILYADGSDVAELETIALDIYGGAVNDDIFISGLPSGAYKVKTVITDGNGFITVKESAVFYIRTKMPQLTLHIDSEKHYEDAPLFSSGTHSLSIKATEAFASVRDDAPEQRFYYIASANAVYGDFVFGGIMKPTAGGYKLVSGDGSDGITVPLPDSLNDGANMIQVLALIVSENDDIGSAQYSAFAEIKIYFDDSAPNYTAEFNDIHTSGSITGTIIAYDDFTNDITAVSDSAVITDITEAGISDYRKYSVEVSENGTHTVVLTDAAGNKATVNVSVSNIDRTAPEFRCIEAPSAVVRGERTDYTAVIGISGHDSEKVRFGFIADTDLTDAYEADGKTIKAGYFDYDYDLSRFTVARISEQPDIYEGESISFYTVTLTALTGNYYLAVYCEDSVGNCCWKLYDDAPFMPRDAVPEMVSYSVSPKEAGTRAILTTEFNVPVSVLPQNKIRTAADMTESEKLEADDAGISYEAWIDEINLAASESFSGNFSQTYTQVITAVGNYSFYVTDETGRSVRMDITLCNDDVIFGTDPAITVKTYNFISDYPTGSYFEEIPEGEYASAYSWFDDKGRSVSTKVTVTAEAGKYLLPDLLTAVDSDVVIDIDGLHFMDDDGMGTNEDSEWVELTDKNGLTFKAYTKLSYNVFPIKDDKGNELDRNERRLKVLYFSFPDDISISEVVFENVELIVDNIDNTRAVTGVHTSPSIEQDMNGEPLYHTLGNVTAEITASDPHTGISRFYFYTYSERENNFDFSFEFTEQLKDENGNLLYEENGDPKIYLDTDTLKKFEASNDYMYIAAYDIPDDKNTKRIEIVFYKNFQGILTVSNGTGCETLVKTPAPEGFEIKSIFKKDISSDDFRLSYYYTDGDGNSIPLPDDSSAAAIYYKSITAVITPTASGIERGLYVMNNSGNLERKLDSSNRSFSFILSDKYGYTLTCEAAADNFDLLPGNVDYTLSTSEPTNKDITVTITASDTQSGVGSVVLTRGVTEIALTNSGDSYTAVLKENGSYTVTVTDIAGNRRQKVFSVSNIDKTPPALTDKIYSFPQEADKHTSKDINVSLKFSEPGVRITKVERSSGSLGSFYVDFSNAVLRFTENMTLDVYFADVCGNETIESVSVNNIYKTPPAVSAKTTVNSNRLTAEVSFTAALNEQTGVPVDTMRKLSELYISFNGITKRADTASYIFNSNGTYTFRVFDDEGVTSYVAVTIDGIDSEAPVITQIRWSYSYDLAQDGNWIENQTASGSYMTGAEAGYAVGTDKFPVTNRDVTVTVVTDKPTSEIGKDGSYTTEHSIIYDGNGMYVFNLEKENGLSASYGVDIGVIDKTPPVIELVIPEIIFFENPNANEKPYNRDMIDKGFLAYDLFGGYTDLTGNVTIDYGGFDPTDLANNVFDRTKPYTITYTVCDDAHNFTSVRMTVRLVSMFDSIVTVNGSLPDYAGRCEIYTDMISFRIMNFSGISYAKVQSGVKTLGQMKQNGTVIPREAGNKFSFKAEEDGWYTFLIQTDKRDYFVINVYVNL